MKVSHYIVRNTDREAVFRIPLWASLCCIPISVFLIWILWVWIVSDSPTVHSFSDWCVFIGIGLPLLLMASFFTYLCVPRQIRFDFARKLYEQNVGVFPVQWETSGSFDDIAGTRVAKRRRNYAVLIAWGGRRARSKFSVTNHCYGLASTTNLDEAIATAQHLAERLGVPYEGIFE